jgi:hypothetical protein
MAGLLLMEYLKDEEHGLCTIGLGSKVELVVEAALFRYPEEGCDKGLGDYSGSIRFLEFGQ